MSDFVNYLHELFENFGPIRSRKMFGERGIYHNDLMFAIVSDDELYLKTDDENIAQFEELGLMPFEYTKSAKVAKLSYSKAPEEIYDDPDLAVQWAHIGYDAALRAQAKKKK